MRRPGAAARRGPEFVVWGQGGLETSLAAALVSGRWPRSRAGAGGRRGCQALAGLTRPDALLPIGLFVATWLIIHGRKDWPGWRRCCRRGRWRPGRCCCTLLWRQHTYGAWLPNTWLIKQFGGLLRGSYGVWYVEAWARGVGLIGVLPLLPWLRTRHLVLVVPLLGTLAYAWWIGGDFMAHGRFLVVATALLAVLVGWLLVDAGRGCVRGCARSRACRSPSCWRSGWRRCWGWRRASAGRRTGRSRRAGSRVAGRA
jgi:arabinofuranosyltransferase